MQQDTDDVSQASLWQGGSDALANEGMAVGFWWGFPWLLALALWDDLLELQWCPVDASLSPSTLVEHLYGRACNDSTIDRFVRESGVDVAAAWQHVC